MPNRIIKDSIHESEKVNAMTDFQFRLWVSLITYVDDYGRGDARPAIIKGNCFPLRDRLTNKDIDAALTGLVQPSKIQNEYKNLYRHIIDWDTISLSSYKYNPKVLGEFYNWYLTRVCIAQGHVCNVDFFILPDQNFWNPE